MPDADAFRETFPARALTFYEIARRILDQQLDSITTLDNRLATAFSLNTVIVALFAAAVAIPSREPPLALWILAIVVLAFFVAGTFCGYRAFSVRDWSGGIDPRQARLHADLDAGEQWALAADVMVNSYHQNVEKLARKERWTQGAIALTTANAAVVSVAAIVATMPW